MGFKPNCHNKRDLSSSSSVPVEDRPHRLDFFLTASLSLNTHSSFAPSPIAPVNLFLLAFVITNTQGTYVFYGFVLFSSGPFNDVDRSLSKQSPFI
jgi:hypothetical protein